MDNKINIELNRFNENKISTYGSIIKLSNMTYIHEFDIQYRGDETKQYIINFRFNYDINLDHRMMAVYDGVLKLGSVLAALYTFTKLVRFFLK